MVFSVLCLAIFFGDDGGQQLVGRRASIIKMMIELASVVSYIKIKARRRGQMTIGLALILAMS